MNLPENAKSVGIFEIPKTLDVAHDPECEYETFEVFEDSERYYVGYTANAFHFVVQFVFDFESDDKHRALEELYADLECEAQNNNPSARLQDAKTYNPYNTNED